MITKDKTFTLYNSIFKIYFIFYQSHSRVEQTINLFHRRSFTIKEMPQVYYLRA